MVGSYICKDVAPIHALSFCFRRFYKSYYEKERKSVGL